MKATAWRGKPRVRTLMALSATLIGLANCSSLPPENAAPPVMPADYGALVANALRQYKAFAGYSEFEISGLRWVHAQTGWNWLVCVRYDDRGAQRTYSVFIEGDTVVNARYDTLTDRCSAQQYAPFDFATGAILPRPPSLPQPIY